MYLLKPVVLHKSNRPWLRLKKPVLLWAFVLFFHVSDHNTKETNSKLLIASGKCALV